jgi:holo-[acyl-carrier protein] synthase
MGIVFGIDLEEITRVERVFSTTRALTRIFTAHEIAYCQPKRHRFQQLAVRFATKEAVFAWHRAQWRTALDERRGPQ